MNGSSYSQNDYEWLKMRRMASYYGDEIYHDPTRMCVRTRSQDMEIRDLRQELTYLTDRREKKVQEETDKKALNELIAHYYNK